MACFRGIRGLAILLLGIAECGERHEATDAGFDAGPATSTCHELEVAEAGTRCEDPGVRCIDVLNEFCSPHEARCEDGRVVHEDHVWVLYRDEDPSTCLEGAFAIDVDGPTGRIHFDRGAASEQAGFTSSATRLLASGEAFHECPRPSLYVMFPPSFHTYEYEGTLQAGGQLVLEGEDGPIVAEGVVTITHDITTGRFEGTLALEGERYTANGAFSVVSCPALGRVSI